MYVREIAIKSFRHLRDVHLGPFREPGDRSDLVVLAGPTGGGKSSVLELIGYALSESWGLQWGLGRSFAPQSSEFEVAIGLTPEERNRVCDHLRTQAVGATPQGRAVVSFLEANEFYYRPLRYMDGGYSRDSALYNEVHRWVTSTLRADVDRRFGLFLKSDRSYPSREFHKDRLFPTQDQARPDHLRRITLNLSAVQYEDMYHFLVRESYHYFRRLGRFCHEAETAAGERPPGDRPADPLKPYDDLLRTILPGYRLTREEADLPSNLFVQIPSGEIIPFADLSSGEKEIFFLLASFLRHDIAHSVVLVDEPELHLHPEFARRVVGIMADIRPGNQLWLATHHSEIIDEAGPDKVFYLDLDPNTRQCRLTHGSDEPDAPRKLKELFGYSGYIGVAKKMVFLEGRSSSADRKMFSRLFPQIAREAKFIPCGTSENLVRVNVAVLSILESGLGYMEFYLIRDRDYMTEEQVKKYRETSPGRLYVLQRHEIENYLLDPELIAVVAADMFDKLLPADKVEERLRAIARSVSAEILRDMVVFRMNLHCSPQDFSIGPFMQGDTVLSEAGTPDSAKVALLQQALAKKAAEISGNLTTVTAPGEVDTLVSQSAAEIEQAVADGSDGWKSLFPGKRLLAEFERKVGFGRPEFLLNALIRQLSTTPERIDAELVDVMKTIADGKTFST